MSAAADVLPVPAIDRRKVLIGLLFCSAAGVAAWRQPTQHVDYLGKAKLEDIVPKSIGRWKFVAASGLVVPPEDQLSKAIYSQMLTRVYAEGDNPPIMLLVAQSGSQTGVLQIHRPEFCYTASGFQVSAAPPQKIAAGSKSLTATALDATIEGRTEHILYWTRIGNVMPESWKAQRWAVAEQNLLGIVPDAILIRISTINENPRAAREAIESFTGSMLESVAPNWRPVFIV
jgi:EpsI family protein